MIFGTWERRKVKEFEKIDRELAFYDFDIVNDRLMCIARKSKDVSAVRNDADLLPSQQHLAIVGDLVMPLFRSEQAVRIDIFKTDKDSLDSCPFRFFDEAGQLMT